METKVIKANTRLFTFNNNFEISVIPDDFEGVNIYTFLANVSTKSELNYFKWNHGDGLVVVSSEEEFYFDVNSDGELIAIYPEEYDFSIGVNGDLMISKI